MLEKTTQKIANGGGGGDLDKEEEAATEMLLVKRNSIGNAINLDPSKVTLVWNQIEVNISSTTFPNCFGRKKVFYVDAENNDNNHKYSNMKTFLCNQSGKLSSGTFIRLRRISFYDFFR